MSEDKKPEKEVVVVLSSDTDDLSGKIGPADHVRVSRALEKPAQEQADKITRVVGNVVTQILSGKR